jgi:hypothetical protein
VFFNNRAQDEQKAKDKAALAKDARDRANEVGDRVEFDRQEALRIQFEKEAQGVNRTFGAGSFARIAATAFSGAAGSNVAGGLGSLAQGAAVNVLQSLAVREIKSIADSLLDRNGNPTAGSETVRAALQSVVGCAGSAAAGTNGCGSAAAGAAASVVLNYLLTSYVDPRNTDGEARSLEDQEARKNLVTTIIAGLAAGTGLNAAIATTTGQIETENNDQVRVGGGTITTCGEGEGRVCTGRGLFVSDYEREPLGSIAHNTFLEAASQLGFDPTNLTDAQRATLNNVLAARIFQEIPFDVFDSPEKTDALIAARNQVVGLRTSDPEAYAALVREAGGSEVLAIYRITVANYYADRPAEYAADFALAHVDPRDLFQAARFFTGAGSQVLTDLGDLAKAILNAPDTARRIAATAQLILEHPDQVIAALGEAGANFVAEVRGNYIGAYDAAVLGDEQRLGDANSRLGALIGAPIIETLAGGAVSIRIAGKVVQIVSRISRAAPDLDAPDVPNAPDATPDPTNPTPGRANSPDTDGEAGAGDGARSRFEPDTNLPDFPESAQRHIIEGEVRGPKNVQGAHYPNSTNIRIDRNTVTTDPGGSGVFQANVSVRGPDGNFLPKSNNGGRSTFFPENWSAQRVLNEINSVASQVPAGASRTIRTPSGVRIVVVKKADGTIRTAYPAWPQ